MKRSKTFRCVPPKFVVLVLLLAVSTFPATSFARDDVFHRGAEYEKATLDEFRLVPDLKAFCWTNWTYAKEVPAGNDTLYGEERFYIVDVGRRVLALVYRNYLGELHPVGGKVLGIEWKRPAAGSPEEALMRRIEGLFSQAG